MKTSDLAIQALTWLGADAREARLIVEGIQQTSQGQDEEMAWFVFDESWIREEIEEHPESNINYDLDRAKCNTSEGKLHPVLTDENVQEIVSGIHENDAIYESLRDSVITAVNDWLNDHGFFLKKECP